MNHSLSPNVEYKVMGIKDHSGKEVPRIAMVSKKVINVGEELLWNYGERSKKIVADNAWLRNGSKKHAKKGGAGGAVRKPKQHARKPAKMPASTAPSPNT